MPLATPYLPARRYQPGASPVVLTGVQAIVRYLSEQHVRDQSAGRRTALFVSGYPGSPLAGLDQVLAGQSDLMKTHHIHHRPAVNEELAATAVWGSQTVPGRPKFEGVVGVWYGKGPGVDRAGDAMRHGNMYGADPRGGVVVMAGDDPGAKSSTVPCASERTLASYGMPVLAPRSGGELITFSLYATELSRLSGCWVGIKVLADVADGLWTVEEDYSALGITRPDLEWEGRPWHYTQFFLQDPRLSTVAEASLVGPRWAAVRAFAEANPIDTVTSDPARAWLGIAATGTAYDATLEALLELGLNPEEAGIRVLRVGMPYPLSRPGVLRLAQGVEAVVVVEEKVAFVESQLKELLYGRPDAPPVYGKTGPDGRVLLPADGQLTSERLLGPLRTVLEPRLSLRPPEQVGRGARRRLPVHLTTSLDTDGVKRTPYFCSGCPHNRSTVLPEGSLGAGGIGCHIMVTLAGRAEADVVGFTQMGGEGAQWIGQAPFTDVGHLFQNLGDGTFAHSGQLAVQACVASGVNITYKILYNSAVAMTGAQRAEGDLGIAALTHKLGSQGVKKTVIVTDDPVRYRSRGRHRVGRRSGLAGLAPGVTVRDRGELDTVQRELRDIPGVTVLIYDQMCANEKRRLRKRHRLDEATTRVVIDEAVCEGCGDCGAKSGCLSVQPVETELGRKTRIDQSSCNADYSCLLGDCPSFLTVTTTGRRDREVPVPPEVPPPPPFDQEAAEIFMAGVGGTGVITVNHILATAAVRHGLNVVGLDQVGLSQKAGPVTSHLRIGPAGPANRVGHQSATLLLGFDLLVAADPAFAYPCASDLTRAVVNSRISPTGGQVTHADAPRVDVERMVEAVRERVRDLFAVDSLGASEAVTGSEAGANLVLVGAACQLGALPMPPEAVEEAIELNGVAVEANRAAFRWGRAAVSNPAALAAALEPAAASERQRCDLGASPLQGPTRDATAVRVALLERHSGPGAARAYRRQVERAWAAERRVSARTDYSLAVARGLAHLMAYKDEYEVARLLTRSDLDRQARRQVPEADRISFNLHPPLFRSHGLAHKIRLGPAWAPLLRALARGRRLRGTPLDPFGRTEIRRLERRLVRHYQQLVDNLTAELDERGYERAVAAASAAEMVRGYEGVKKAAVERYRVRLNQLGLPGPDGE
jgi:indolepyruvate ferredoxin oxidoreductase